MSTEFDRELEVAISAVTRAAKLCAAVRAGVSPDSLAKKDRSPVTVADFGSQAIVCKILADAFRDDPVIAEEDSAELRGADAAVLLEQVSRHVAHVLPGAGTAEVCGWIDRGGCGEYRDRFWTLDPIDGTKGFLRNEQYAVALALIVEGRPTVAALACPNLDGGAVFAAVVGQGAFAVEPDGGRHAIHVTHTHEPRGARFCESVESGHSSHDDASAIAEALGISAEPIRMDSQCKYAVVARGDADIYLRLPTRPGYVERIWDHAAGALVITEAGGKVTDITGRNLDFTHGRGLERNRGVVATNGRLHGVVLEQVAARIAV